MRTAVTAWIAARGTWLPWWTTEAGRFRPSSRRSSFEAPTTTVKTASRAVLLGAVSWTSWQPPSLPACGASWDASAGKNPSTRGGAISKCWLESWSIRKRWNGLQRDLGDRARLSLVRLNRNQKHGEANWGILSLNQLSVRVTPVASSSRCVLHDGRLQRTDSTRNSAVDGYVLAGDIEAFKDTCDLTWDRKPRVQVEDYWLSREDAIEQLYERMQFPAYWEQRARTFAPGLLPLALLRRFVISKSRVQVPSAGSGFHELAVGHGRSG